MDTRTKIKAYIKRLDNDIRANPLDILLNNLTPATRKLVLDEIEAKLEPHLQEDYKAVEQRIEAHLDKLPDTNEYKKWIKDGQQEGKGKSNKNK